MKIFSLPAAHDNAIETIVQEAENMLRLEHNRIVPLYGISSSLENKEIHIIMPFYQMGSLKSYIRQFHNELKVMCGYKYYYNIYYYNIVVGTYNWLDYVGEMVLEHL